jgi:integrase
MTFTELSTEWLARKGHLDETSRTRYEYAVQSIGQYVTGLPDPDQKRMPKLNAELMSWQACRRDELSPSTFNLELACCKAIFRYAEKQGYLAADPTADVRPSKFVRKESPVPTEEQFAALVAKLRAEGGDDAADFAEFLAYSGCREDESRWLRWGDVELDRSRVLIGRDGIAKNGRENYLPLFPKLFALLTAVKAKRTNTDADTLIWSGVQLRYRLRKACAELGLPMFHHHSFRHFFAVQALKRLGMNKVGVVAKWLNHQDGGRLLLSLYGNHVTDTESQELAQCM